MYKLASTVRLGLTAALGFAFVFGLHAQSDRRGSVSGTVTSTTGTPTVNITVVLENMDNGARRQVTSDATGKYRFDDVQAGRYRMSTNMNGVTSAPSGEVDVSAGTASVVNLSVGPPSRTVSTTSPVTAVEEATPIQEMTGPRIQSSWNTRDVENQPAASYLSRNGAMFGAYNLSLYSAGVASNGGVGSRGPVVGGQRPWSNNYWVDGIDNTNHAIPGPLTTISNEATAEFLSSQNQFPPEYGHTTGGQFNAVLRTGTNKFHGALYDYLQNKNLNAMDVSFARAGIRDNPRYDQNRLGGNFGFPIIQDKLFTFLSFEYIPLGFDSIPVSPVFGPTAAGYGMLGNLNGISSTNLQVLQSTLPAASTPTTFTTVNGAQIPLGIVATSSRNWQNQYNGVGALDWKFGQSDNLQARYVQNRLIANSNGAQLPAFSTDLGLRSLVASLAEVHNFNNGAVNELRLGYTRIDQHTRLSQFAFPGLNTPSFPFIAIEETNIQLGQGLVGPQDAEVGTFYLADNLHWRFGRHTVRAGYDGRRIIGPVSFPQLAAGSFIYSNLQGFLNNQAPDVAGQRSVGSLRLDTNQWNSYVYLKDEWRMSPNLEVDLGVRYEYASIPAFFERQANNSAASVPGVLVFGEPEPQKTAFAPQVGLAYSPGIVKNSVFRLGFGMNYDANAYSTLGPVFAPGAATTFYTNSLNSAPGFFGSTGFFNPAFGSNLSPQARSTYFLPDLRLPYTMQWNASWTQQIFRRFVLDVRYLGVRGVHLPATNVINQISPVTSATNLPVFSTTPSQATLNNLTTTLNSLQPINPLASAGFTSPIIQASTSGNSIYNGLAVEGTQRFSGGFQMKAAYTWSHLIDDVTPITVSPIPALSLLETRTTRDTSVFDHRHRGALTWLWDVGGLPAGSNRWVRDIVANLIFAGTYTYESPAPTSILGGFGGLVGGFGSGVVINPNGIAGVGSGVTPLMNSQGQIVAYQVINPNAQFIAGAPGTLASNFRNTFTGLNPINNWDISGVKRFAIRDRFDFQVFCQAYNLFNHSQFTAAELNNIGFQPQSLAYLMPGSPIFGDVGSAFSNHPRTLQVGLKLLF